MEWFEVEQVDQIDSPSLLIFKDRVRHNIDTMLATVDGDPHRLFPHVKTHKQAQIIQMQLDAGIRRFKCATISEAEMVLAVGAPFVLIAYQLTGPKIARYTELVKQFGAGKVGALVDNLASAHQLASACLAEGQEAIVFIDVNSGHNRTGIPVHEDVAGFYEQLHQMEGLEVFGLHIYDGHIRISNFDERKAKGDTTFAPVWEVVQAIEDRGLPTPQLVAGGSPAFVPTSMRDNVYCSPGTTLLWDFGYSQIVPEMPLKWAAVLLTRIISKPAPGIVTTDLGHKSVAAENPLHNRIRFLNLDNYEPIGHSEEHLVLKVANWESLSVGDILYGIPFHVCPSVALHDVAYVIQQNQWVDSWEVMARKRKLTI